MEENLKVGGLIIRICPIANKPIICQYEGNDRVLNLHNDTMEENLKVGDLIIRICPITRKPILCQYEGNDRVLDLHNDTMEEDMKEVINFLRPYFSS